MAGTFHVERLSDEFGQYSLALTCGACGYERIAEPKLLGRLCGWDARLADVARRLRCSKCGRKACKMRVIPPKKPRGYSSLPK
jgi:hypothetical protein